METTHDDFTSPEYALDYLKSLLNLASEAEYADALFTDLKVTSVAKNKTEEKLGVPFGTRGTVFRVFKKGEWREAAFSDIQKKEQIRDTLAKLSRFTPTTDHKVKRISSAKPWKGNFAIRGKKYDVDEKEKLDLIRHYFTLARQVDSRIIDVSANYRDYADTRAFVNSHGSELTSSISKVGISMSAVARENDRVDYDYLTDGKTGGFEVAEEILSDEKVVRLAKGALELLNAKQVPSGTFDVVLDPGMTGTFAHESFGHGCEADQVLRGRSYLVNYLGKQLGPEDFTLYDDATLENGWGSFPFDDEGIPAQKTAIVERGVLASFIQDRISSAEMNAKPTGNARRESYRRPVYVRMTNTYVGPGDTTFDELIKEVRDGIFAEHWNSGIEDPIGGNMQLKCKRSWRIQNGEIAEPYSTTVLSGKVLEFVKNIRAMTRGNDFQNGAGTCGKGEEDMVPVGSGGTYLASRAVVGQG